MALILLIEDNAALRRALTRILEGAGHTVQVTTDGRAGLRAFQEARPDLVITDLHMPEVSGIEVILTLQAAAPGVPVIAASGSGKAETLVLLDQARLLGAVGVLPKPFSRAEVIAAVNAALLPRTDAAAGDAAG